MSEEVIDPEDAIYNEGEESTYWIREWNEGRTEIPLLPNKSLLLNRRKIWVKKWALGSLFIFSTIFAFLGFLDVAPAGIFSEFPTQYVLDFSSTSTQAGDDIVVDVSKSPSPNDPNEGIIIGGEEASIGLISVWAALIYLVTVGVFQYYRRKSSEICIGCSAEGEQLELKLGNGIYSSLLAAISGLFFFLLIWAFVPTVSGKFVAVFRLGVLGMVVYVLSIAFLLYEYSKRLPFKKEPKNKGIYIQRHGQIAQGSLSLGLGIAIGGMLSFATAGDVFAQPVLFIVSIFFVPLAGIAACRYYRIRETEKKCNR